MKLPSRILLTPLVVALALPLAAFAAKGDRKKNETPAVSFTTIDKDSDGVVTEAEYIAAAKDKLSEEAAKAHFASLDKNSDGKLSKEEFAVDDTFTAKKRGKKKPK
jgi:Ca2+-binding EF-hand superfamily protein